MMFEKNNDGKIDSVLNETWAEKLGGRLRKVLEASAPEATLNGVLPESSMAAKLLGAWQKAPPRDVNVAVNRYTTGGKKPQAQRRENPASTMSQDVIDKNVQEMEQQFCAPEQDDGLYIPFGDAEPGLQRSSLLASLRALGLSPSALGLDDIEAIIGALNKSENCMITTDGELAEPGHLRDIMTARTIGKSLEKYGMANVESPTGSNVNVGAAKARSSYILAS